MCCKLLAIEELRKPMGVWCASVLKGRGCSAYAQRPHACRAFECLWLRNDELPDYWKPDRSKMIVAGDETGTLISIIVDSGHDDAWTKAPFYSDIKAIAAQRRWRVQVLTAKHGWVIFPEEDLFLGERKPDDEIVGYGYKDNGEVRQPGVAIRHGDGTVTEVVGQVYRKG